MSKVDERTVRMGDEGPLHNNNRKATCIHAVTRVQNLFADALRLGMDYPSDTLLENMVRDAEWNALWNPREIAKQHDQDPREMRRIWNMALGANVVEESELISERKKRERAEQTAKDNDKQAEILARQANKLKDELDQLRSALLDCCSEKDALLRQLQRETRK